MGVVNTQYTFAANDVITSTKMNDIIDQTTIDETAILGNTLEVAGGKLKVRAQGITSNELAASAVTNTQIANGSVTYDKLGAAGPSWDGNGTLYSNGLRLSSNAPILNFNETDTGKQWFWVADGSGFSLRFNDYNTYSLSADGSGNVTFFQNATTNGTSTVNGAATFASTASFTGNVTFNSGAITSKGYAGSTAKGVVFLGDAGNGYIYNNGTHLEFNSPTGGLSYLLSSGTIWQSGNDGAGSGLDADLLDGLQPTPAATVSTIVSRNQNGDSSFSTVYATTFTGSFNGNANTATNLSTTRATWASNGTVSAVVGQLTWNNFGNNHTIFDASQGVTPSGTACNKTNSDVGWYSDLPALMGWNGTSTHGVRVDSAKSADTATTATTVSNGAISAAKLSGAQTGAAPVYGARALGVVALTPTGRSMLNSGGNIGSVTRIDPTHTQINFAVNMPYTNYVVSGCVLNDANLEFATFEHNVDNFKIRHSSDTAGRNVQFVVFA